MTPHEYYLFVASFFLYVCGGLLFTVNFLLRKSESGKYGVFLTGAGFITHTLALLVRMNITGYAPMTNMYESLSFFSWSTVGVLIIVRYVMKINFAEAFTAPVYIIFLGLAYTFAPNRIPTLVPALQSWMLPAHVMLAFIGEAWFVIGFVAAIMFLIKKSKFAGFADKLPEADVLDSFSYRAISLGYPLFTFGAIILGMAWAHKAWGRYWGWDPKEVWALVTFIVYSLYLHGRYRWGWKGSLSAYLAIIGFAVTLFTLFGVNLLLSGLHSYGSGM
jgi:cytochrome c-type biogenesis protein CcsB